MNASDSVVAVFPTHDAAEAAIKTLADGGFDMKTLSLVGRGYQTEEKVTGFYNIGDRVAFWGTRGAFWGGFWGLFFGGVFLTIPILGHVIVLGYLAATIISGLEGAITVGGLSALGAALYSLGMPRNSVLDYEADVKADSFLVMAHGTPSEMTQAHALLQTAEPMRLHLHVGSSMEPDVARALDAVS
jgi:hypothetical protein